MTDVGLPPHMGISNKTPSKRTNAKITWAARPDYAHEDSALRHAPPGRGHQCRQPQCDQCGDDNRFIRPGHAGHLGKARRGAVVLPSVPVRVSSGATQCAVCIWVGIDGERVAYYCWQDVDRMRSV